MPRRQPTQMELPGTATPETDLPISPLRTGCLVGLATHVRGNVTHNRETIEEPHKLRNGAVRSVIQTERTVSDQEEYDKANQVRMKIRALIISGICAKCSFGLICTDNLLDKLTLAKKEAEKLVVAFNRTARHTTVEFSMMLGRVAQDDVTAVRAIKSELRGLIGEMAQAVKDCDVGKIREAANKTRSVSMALSPGAAEQAKVAIEAARSAARKIAKAGETAAVEIDREAVRALSAARTAFLDTDDDDTEIAAPETEARAVDIADDAGEDEGEAETAPVEPVRSPTKRPAKKAARRVTKPGKASRKASNRVEARAGT